MTTYYCMDGLTKVILALTAFGASLAALWHYFSDGNG